MLDFSTGLNRFVVRMPDGAAIACAASAVEGSLVAAVSTSGSAALWSGEGRLLSLSRGKSAIKHCVEEDFVFDLPTRRVVSSVSPEPARLLGEGVAVALREGIAGALDAAFASGRLFVNGAHAVTVYDAASGTPVTKLAGRFDHLAVSGDGAYFALQHNDTQAALYEASSLRAVQIVAGRDPAFHLDMLIVEREPPGDGLPNSTAYALAPFSKRWDQAQIAIYEDRESDAADSNSSRWRVGMSRSGYSVFDVTTGRTLAAWDSSGFGCGYQWLWHEGSLVFVEGSKLTFWDRARGAKTHTLDCEGALAPTLSPDGSKLVALDSVWDVKTRRRVTQLQMPQGGGVIGFSPDGRSVIGQTAVGNDVAPSLVAWSAVTGQVIWHRDQKRPGEATDNVHWHISEDQHSAMFLDTNDGTFHHVGNLVGSQGTQQLFFDEACWAGPKAPPARGLLPPDFPTKHCPELVGTFREMVRTASQGKQ